MTSATVFEAVIVPHRSLTPSGARWLAGGLCGLSAVISTGLWFLGAWPVIGFNGGEIALALLLLRLHARGRGASELLLLSPDGLRIVQVAASGRRREQVLEPGWLHLTLEERAGRIPALWLASRGRRYEVAAILGESEKRDLADALRGALERLQRPVFDNPQLRTL